MLNRHRKLRMEQMEAREMMAGDVTASVVNGSLYLTEAAGQTNRDNAVTISQISASHVRVTGNATTTDHTFSKINGAASRTSPSSAAWISSLPEAAISLCSTRLHHHRF